jgi:hypothetical protein
MTSTPNTIELTSTDLEHITGGGTAIAGVATNPVLLKAEQQLATIYQNNHPIHLGSFQPPHTAVPR